MRGLSGNKRADENSKLYKAGRLSQSYLGLRKDIKTGNKIAAGTAKRSSVFAKFFAKFTGKNMGDMGRKFDDARVPLKRRVPLSTPYDP